MKRIATIIIALALLVPSTALASGSSTCQTYNGALCSVSSNNATQNTPTTTTSSSTLPFTGLDVVLLAVGGGTLLGAGVVVRRLSRSASE